MLGHPQGRMYNSRAGVNADWPRVFATAAERGVAIEIDGNWHRQDVHYGLARQALDAGCIFALDSDAHSIGELRFTDYSIAHARLAGIPAGAGHQLLERRAARGVDEGAAGMTGKPANRRTGPVNWRTGELAN